jgi:SAM-dependent methyltransferase
MKDVPPQLLQSMMTHVAGATQHYVAAVQTALTGMQAALDGGGKMPAAILAELCQSTRRLAADVHQAKFAYDWNLPPTPEWHDHFLDQFYQFRKDRVSFWLERGVYGVLALRRGGTVLELCCGDGYNSYHFYSGFAAHVTAVDFDDAALEHARRYNNAPNIEFRHADIRTDLPTGTFDNVVWDAAIEHFTETEIAGVMAGIKQRLKPSGILSGYTIVEQESGEKHIHQHEREFRSKQDLAQFFTPHFANVKVFETIHPTRHNLYFYCADGALPFDPDWPFALTQRRPASRG